MALSKKKRVSAVERARQNVDATLATFAVAKSNLETAVDTFKSAAQNNKAYAQDLLAEADRLSAEADANAKVAKKLAEFVV